MSTCNEYVQKNPQAFTNSFWSIDYIKVFGNGVQANAPPSSGNSNSNEKTNQLPNTTIQQSNMTFQPINDNALSANRTISTNSTNSLSQNNSTSSEILLTSSPKLNQVNASSAPQSCPPNLSSCGKNCYDPSVKTVS